MIGIVLYVTEWTKHHLPKALEQVASLGDHARVLVIDDGYIPEGDPEIAAMVANHWWQHDRIDYRCRALGIGRAVGEVNDVMDEWSAAHLELPLVIRTTPDAIVRWLEGRDRVIAGAEATTEDATPEPFAVPTRIVVDPPTFERVCDLAEHPPPPTPAMRALTGHVIQPPMPTADYEVKAEVVATPMAVSYAAQLQRAADAAEAAGDLDRASKLRTQAYAFGGLQVREVR